MTAFGAGYEAEPTAGAGARPAAALPGSAAEAARLTDALLLRGHRPRRRLAAHRVLDQARAGGYLDATLSLLQRGRPGDRLVESVAREARPRRRPRVIAHRGLPLELPENTLPSIAAALDRGADALEVDVVLTADDQLVLWHDAQPNALLTTLRRLGLERLRYRPALPWLLSPARRPTHELDLATLRARYGYRGPEGPAAVELPTLDQVAALVRDRPGVAPLIVDAKLPPGRPDLLVRLARRLRAIIETAGLEARTVVTHCTAGALETLERELCGAGRVAIDLDLVALLPRLADFERCTRAALRTGRVLSLGRPRVGLFRRRTYLEGLRRAREALDAAGGRTPLLTWTINDELTLRQVIGIGVDGILTDDVGGLCRLRDRLFPAAA